jgi:hypothetical protein
VQLGSTLTTMVIWPLPNDPIARRVLLMHESWHRVQVRIGLPMSNPPNPQLSTADGRYWLQLEWEALASAVVSSGRARADAVDDALSFRAARFAEFPGAMATENSLMMNEGLAEYTGVALGTLPAQRPVRVVEELGSGRARASFERSFAYASGPAYGYLLDVAAPRWRAHLTPRSDLGALLASAYHVVPARAHALLAVARYDDGALRVAEDVRGVETARRVAEARRQFVDGPVLRIVLNGAQFTFDPNRVTGLQADGAIYGSFNASGWFGTLDAPDGALVSSDFSTIAVPTTPTGAPADGATWKLQLAPGCVLAADARPGDHTIACASPVPHP